MLAAKSSNRRSRSQKSSRASLAAPESPHRAGRLRDRDAKQQALVMAALKLFASKGYEATTTREIANCAGCAEGLIHRYFRGKAGLLSALIRHRISKEVADLTHNVRPAQSLKEEYLQLVDWAVEHMWEDREFLRVALPRAVLDPTFGRALRRIVRNRRPGRSPHASRNSKSAGRCRQRTLMRWSNSLLCWDLCLVLCGRPFCGRTGRVPPIAHPRSLSSW